MLLFSRTFLHDAIILLLVTTTYHFTLMTYIFFHSLKTSTTLKNTCRNLYFCFFPHISFFCVINVPIFFIYYVLINQYICAVTKITYCNGNSSKGLLTMSGILFNSDLCSIPQLMAHCGL